MRTEIDNTERFFGKASLAYVDSRLVFNEVTEEQKAQWIDRLASTVDVLEASGEIVDGLPLADEAPTFRRVWAEMYGWDTAEALAVAKHYNATIWTDDRRVAISAAEDIGVHRVWTEVVCKWASDRGIISFDRFIAVIADLVALGYWHTQLFSEAAIKMANDAEWDFRREPFKHAIEWMGSAGVSADSIRVLAEGLLPQVYGTQDPLINSATVQAILGSIGQRRDGRSIIRELRRRVSFYCGMDYAAERKLQQDMDVWLRSRQVH